MSIGRNRSSTIQKMTSKENAKDKTREKNGMHELTMDHHLFLTYCYGYPEDIN